MQENSSNIWKPMNRLISTIFLLTTNLSWWKKETHPVSAAVLTASMFKLGKPLKQLISCFISCNHWLKPVVNDNLQSYKSARLDALLSSRNKNLVFLSELSLPCRSFNEGRWLKKRGKIWNLSKSKK
jgi:hypothetical protein